MVQQSYQRLLENNRKWVTEKLTIDPLYFTKMAEGQTPNYLFIGCSDSRVPANEITGTDAGELFVHRNIANMVVHTDMNLMAVVHYSVEVLKVKHIIVCGHYGCGGVKAAVDGKQHGLIDKWLRNIKDVHRMYFDELSSIADPEIRHRRLVELNVREQVYHICMIDSVQKTWQEERGVHVHGWVYNIEDGLIKDLNINIDSEFKDHPELAIYEFDDL